MQPPPSTFILLLKSKKKKKFHITGHFSSTTQKFSHGRYRSYGSASLVVVYLQRWNDLMFLKFLCLKELKPKNKSMKQTNVTEIEQNDILYLGYF